MTFIAWVNVDAVQLHFELCRIWAYSFNSLHNTISALIVKQMYITAQSLSKSTKNFHIFCRSEIKEFSFFEYISRSDSVRSKKALTLSNHRDANPDVIQETLMLL